MATYYAWSNIIKDRDEWGKVGEVIHPGDEVSASDLGVEDEEFDELVAIGSIREQKYPDAVASGDYQGSPTEYYKDLLVQASEGTLLTPEQHGELVDTGVVLEEVAPAAATQSTTNPKVAATGDKGK